MWKAQETEVWGDGKMSESDEKNKTENRIRSIWSLALIPLKYLFYFVFELRFLYFVIAKKNL